MDIVYFDFLPQTCLHALYLDAGVLHVEYRWGRQGLVMFPEEGQYRVTTLAFSAEKGCFTQVGDGLLVQPDELVEHLHQVIPQPELF